MSMQARVKHNVSYCPVMSSLPSSTKTGIVMGGSCCVTVF
jgi:hypothetical protein